MKILGHEVSVGRTMDVDRLYEVSRPMVERIADDRIGTAGWRDFLSRNVGDERNFFFGVEVDGHLKGFIGFLWRGNDTYEAHLMLGKSCRGPISLHAGFCAQAYMFQNTHCAVLIGKCPHALPYALPFAMRSGFRAIGRTNDFVKQGKTSECTTVMKTKAHWMHQE